MNEEWFTRGHLKLIFTLWVIGQIIPAGAAVAQFSPGELSRSHQSLEGTKNCITCHEVGREISGTKCLVCHQEIQQAVTARHGFHFSVSSRACITCHKEHLGREAKTVQFSEKSFDHDQTGFPLGGKHGPLTCDRCHAAGMVVDREVKDMIAKFPHQSYLGLSSSCNSCHKDPHAGKFKQECAACHTPASWSSVNTFDHSKTRYPLDGKHLETACAKCHTGMERNRPDGQVDFKTAAFADCAPCHTSAHHSKFENRECASCHSTGGWSRAIEKPFNHDLTRYRLVGKHSTVRCVDCHHQEPKAGFARTWLRPHDRCLDCHEDRHHGEFTKVYNNNCSSCHSEFGFKPSTFTLARHEKTAFPLTGAHIAVLCSDCHSDSSRRNLVFHFKNQSCESCHRDVHRGQFTTVMGGSGCVSCHATEDWKKAAFDHSRTSFPLLGKHAAAACSDCHKKQNRGNGAIQLAKASSACESCHKEIHHGQFASDGKTECSKCHKPDNWTAVTFDHETQSSFPLQGAHKTVACKDCHHAESTGQSRFVRFKPLASACASCHGQKEVK